LGSSLFPLLFRRGRRAIFHYFHGFALARPSSPFPLIKGVRRALFFIFFIPLYFICFSPAMFTCYSSYFIAFLFCALFVFVLLWPTFPLSSYHLSLSFSLLFYPPYSSLYGGGRGEKAGISPPPPPAYCIPLLRISRARPYIALFQWVGGGSFLPPSPPPPSRVGQGGGQGPGAPPTSPICFLSNE